MMPRNFKRPNFEDCERRIERNPSTLLSCPLLMPRPVSTKAFYRTMIAYLNKTY